MVGHAVRIGAQWASERAKCVIAWATFALAAVISMLVVGLAGQGQTLKGDEWGYADRLATSSLTDAIFNTAPGKYLLVLPMLLYKLAFSTIGISHYWPYRGAGIALTIAAAALLLVLAARRVGWLLALPGAVLILFLGSGSEVTATPLRIPEQIAVVAGLGALLLLQRKDLRGDVIACVLLLVSITSHPLGAAFVVAGAVLVLARPAPERWERIWVFAVPLACFGAWFLTLREPAPDSLSLASQLRDLPRFEFQSLAAMVAALTGIFRAPVSGHLDYLTPLSYALAGALTVGIVIRALTTRLPATFWAILAAALVLFAAPAFAPGALRSPDESRYIFSGVIVLILLVCEAFAGITFSRNVSRAALAVGVAAVFGFAVYSNATVLDQNAGVWADRGLQVRAELTALDLAGSRAAPDFQPEDPTAQPPVPSTHTGLVSLEYLRIKAAYGTPAFSPSELKHQSADVREFADLVLARALGVRLHPIQSLATHLGSRPRVITTAGTAHNVGSGCVKISAHGQPAATQLALPRLGAELAVGRGSPVELSLARYGSAYAYSLSPLQPRGAAALGIPPDMDNTPWRLLIRPTNDDVTVCGSSLG